MIADTWNSWGFSVKQRKGRRRLVVGYWIVVAIFTAAFIRYGIVHHGVYATPWTIYVLAFFPALLGGVRAGGAVKPFRGLRFAPLYDRDQTQTVFGKAQPVIAGVSAADLVMDERELHERDRMHFLAYTVARWAAMGLLAICLLVSWWRAQWIVWMAPTCLFLLVLTLWSLPQSLILWTEPDVEEPR